MTCQDDGCAAGLERSLPPYELAPEALNIVVVTHGTELVTTTKKSYLRYQDVTSH